MIGPGVRILIGSYPEPGTGALPKVRNVEIDNYPPYFRDIDEK